MRRLLPLSCFLAAFASLSALATPVAPPANAPTAPRLAKTGTKLRFSLAFFTAARAF